MYLYSMSASPKDSAKCGALGQLDGHHLQEDFLMPLHASEAASAPTKCSSPLTGGWEAFRAGSVVGFLIHACVVRAAERKETAALLCPLLRVQSQV